MHTYVYAVTHACAHMCSEAHAGSAMFLAAFAGACEHVKVPMMHT